jgi:LPXTG-site transpeptidase (sortase) family protein
MRKIRKALMLALVVSFMSAAFLPITAYADENDGSPIAITVVVPRPEDNQPAPAPPVMNHVYPIHVWESRENGRREIIRVFELRENESPAQIPREPFERDGFRFELAERVRREIPAHNVREHTEVIELSTQTNDLETVIRLLSPTLEHISEDGYFGVLELDIASIQIASQGTTSSNFTATRTREFPHLSNSDTSLVPRTITENGRTYNLSNVEWRTQGSSAIDYRQVATTFTAVATYSRVGTRTATIGYTTTAEYRGQISRVAVGRTEFTAHFIGIPIVTPVINTNPPAAEAETEAAAGELQAPTPTPPPVPSPNHATIESVIVEQVQVGGIVIEVEQPAPTPPPIIETEDYDTEEYEPENDSNGFPFRFIGIALLFIGGMVLAYFAGKKGKAFLASMKKASCVLLACGLMYGAFGAAQTVYAVELPRYVFGARNEENAVHFDNRESRNDGASSASAEAMHFNPSAASQTVMHFDPQRSDITARASPTGLLQSGNAHNYSYGDVIGTLTVERLGRTVNIIAGATMSAMDFGAGHFSFTGLNYGNTGLIGHNRGRAGFFSFVRNLQEGDILTLDAGGIVRSYTVTMLYMVDESDFSPLMQFSDHRITLITCVEYQRSQRRVAVAIAAE